MIVDQLNGLTDPKEKRRLEVLHEYGILDTKPQKEFNELTALAAEVCNAPVARINLIDKQRQWSKAVFGQEDLDIDIPRKSSICHYTVKKEAVLEIEDLTKDPMFSDRPYVVDYPKLRYYLGAPLITPDGYTIGSLCVLDYELRKMGKRQIRQLRILASEVIARFELHKQNRKLQELNEHKVNLMKILSHDMRSPINGIVGLSNILADEIEDDNQLELVNLLEQSAHQLNHMIDEVLSYSLIESKGFQLTTEPTDLENIVKSMLKLYNPVAQSKGVDLSFESSVNEKVELDKNKFEQIYGNLLSNALKFTESGGSVKSSLSLIHGENGKKLLLEVSDTGIGMDENTVNKLFDNDKVESKSGTSGEKSTGLGSSIIKYFVELHLGSIDVKSVKGKGTTFTITLPVSKN